MLITVIIPTCNRNDLLSKCLDGLSPAVQTCDENDYEVLVTDDSAAGIAKELIDQKYPWVKWVAGYKTGPAANRNNGAKHANGEWLVFIDDDVLPEADILFQYKQAITKYPGSSAFEGAILPDDLNLLKKDMAECPVNTEGNCFWSANICIKKSLFTDVNGFDETYLIPAQEDQDMFEKLKMHSTVPFLRECVVVHPVRFGSVKKRLSRMKIEFANWIYYTEKHSDKSVNKHLFKSIFDYIKMAIKDVLRLKFRVAFLDIVKSGYSLYLCITYSKADRA